MTLTAWGFGAESRALAKVRRKGLYRAIFRLQARIDDPAVGSDSHFGVKK